MLGVGVDVQKGPLMFREIFDNKRVNSSSSHFHPYMSYDKSPQ